jgi:hypothetical protein
MTNFLFIVIPFFVVIFALCLDVADLRERVRKLESKN